MIHNSYNLASLDFLTKLYIWSSQDSLITDYLLALIRLSRRYNDEQKFLHMIQITDIREAWAYYRDGKVKNVLRRVVSQASLRWIIFVQFPFCMFYHKVNSSEKSHISGFM